MFGWRRRNEGFDWQEYVRTTVLVRRADRQRRIDDARAAAIEKVQHAKDRGIEVGKAGLDLAADQAARAAKSTAHGVGAALLALAGAFASFLKSTYYVAAKIVAAYLPERAQAKTERPVPVHERYQKRAEAAPSPRERRASLMERLERNAAAPKPELSPAARTRLRYALQGAGVLGLILIGGQMLQSGDGLETGSIGRSANLEITPIDLEGRAVAVTGDALRIDGQIVRLAGVTAPDDNQPCFNARGRRWSCGAYARKALDRLVRGARVACKPSGADDTGVTLASCEASGEDLARAMTRAGHVFADTGFFASYRAEEDEARAEKVGVWQGETVRPSEWRERVWEEAKRTAPEGCPIRGTVRAGESFYAMPWSNDYLDVRRHSGKSDRWFCSEQDARDAGFKPMLMRS